MSMASDLHFTLFPLMAPGHIIPMIDIAKLLAQRDGVTVSIITTPRNAHRFTATIDRSGLPIRLLLIPFPSLEAGLPEGCENLDSLPSLGMSSQFFAALNLLQKDAAHLFDEMRPRPNCLISDMGLPWTGKIAQKLNIPRIVFHGTCCFTLLCSLKVRASRILDTLKSGSDCFEVPDMPGTNTIVMRKCQFFGSAALNSDALKEVTDQIVAADTASYGVVANTFDDLEAEYVEEYRKVKGGKVWCIGPVSLCNTEALDLADRGNRDVDVAGSQEDCLRWLDSRDPESVIYASLGSLARLTREQMIELALGLESASRPFVWALGGGKSEAFEEWLSESGFSERTKERGFLIRGWAPQMRILSHCAVGGFLTHCGWNSTLEGISAGVPMVTWPFFADQFCNEKLVVQVVGTGVSIGVEVPVVWGEEDKVGVLVKRDDVARALESLMDEGEEGRERRRRAREAAEKAKRAVGEGGSSHRTITSLIQDIKLKSEGVEST